jgi:uncharacterized protein (DUF302 family)
LTSQDDERAAPSYRTVARDAQKRRSGGARSHRNDRSADAAHAEPCSEPREIEEKGIVTNPFSSRARVALLALSLSVASIAPVRAEDPSATVPQSGIVKIRSAYPVQETVARIRKDVASKGIMFFSEVDQQRLARDAGIDIGPSTLLTFGNPPLGTLFIKANQLAGLDWPVRVLVLQDEKGNVWVAYTDFGWIAKRHGVAGVEAESFRKASGVIASITSSVR